MNRFWVSVLIVTAVLLSSSCLSKIALAQEAAANDDNIVGQWTLKYTARNQQSTAKLLITRSDNGTLSGKWDSARGASEIAYLKFKDGKLTFLRRLTLQGRVIALPFVGKIEGGKLTGQFDSSRGKMPVSGTRSGTIARRPSDRSAASQRGRDPRARTRAGEAGRGELRPSVQLSGTMKTETITGPISKKQITFYVYLPAGYYEGEKRYPVTIFLHGIGQARGGVLPRGFAEGAFGFLDRAMRSGKISPHIRTVPYSVDKNMWADAKDGPSMAETNVVKEIIPYVDGKYRTIADRKPDEFADRKRTRAKWTPYSPKCK